jgi:hypothetical protein
MTGAKTRLARVILLSTVLAAVFAAACDDDSGGSCGQVQPCGGNVVGEYNVSAACTSDPAVGDNPLGFDCPEATVDVTGISVTGSASFKADMSYSLMTTARATAQVTFPPSCITPLAGGLTLTCAQINDLIPLLLASMPGTVESAQCAGSATCSCNVVLAPQIVNETGTYVASGTTLTRTDSSTGQLLRGNYCVQGNALHFMQVDMLMPMTITADTVLTRK